MPKVPMAFKIYFILNFPIIISCRFIKLDTYPIPSFNPYYFPYILNFTSFCSYLSFTSHSYTDQFRFFYLKFFIYLAYKGFEIGICFQLSFSEFSECVFSFIIVFVTNCIFLNSWSIVKLSLACRWIRILYMDTVAILGSILL